MIQAAHNQKQINTGGLAKLLQLKIGVKVIFTVNIDIQDWLINGEVGKVVHISAFNNIVQKIYVKFSDQEAGLQREAKLLCGDWKVWNKDTNKERSNISIN